MARLGRFGFLAVAVIFHVIYTYSIFDIYFVSPVVHGMTSFAVERDPTTEAPAKRLVLIVGDGLRADKAFQSFPDPSPSNPNTPGALEPQPLAPFLRSRVLKSGTFGVSHTRVPTESRPGHVALIAGLYEDVSAVMTGWKLNPVNFDSVFNQSRHTWSWGSPDILPMFKEGAVSGRVDAETYGEEFEDFTKDATQLDTWVFEKVKKLFGAAAKNATLDHALKEDKNVFFLHLLGLDTTGHAYRPYSQEYLNNIKVVDQGVREMTKVIEDFYGDGKTAFVFTADHGMSDWGSHGDGHPDNTRTPLIVWGSGVAKPIISDQANGHEDGFSADWGLNHVQRNDVEQADVAALMAYLAGLDFPVNSVGKLPLAYISGDSREKAEAALANTRGVLEMYRVKEEQKKNNELRYKGYPPLGDEHHSVEHRAATIREAIDQGFYQQATDMSQELLDLGLNGLRYLQTYDWLFLRALVTIGYLGWIAFAVTTVIDMHVLNGEMSTSRTLTTTASFGAVATILFSMLVVRKAPLSYYAYAIFPPIFWEEVIARREALVTGWRKLVRGSQGKPWTISLGIQTLAFIAILELLVLSYFHRVVYTVCFILASVWPMVYGREFVMHRKDLVATWAVACLSMSIFTLLPAVKVENINLILLGGFLMALVGILYILLEKRILSSPKSSSGASPKFDSISSSILGVQIGLIILSMFVTKSSVSSIQSKRGLPLGNQVVGWLVLIASLTVPFLHGLQPNNHYLHRLVVIFLTFSPVFIILTISYEGLFYFAFCATLITWVRLEHHIYNFHATPSSSPPPTPTLAPKPLSDAVPNISSQLQSSSEYPDASKPSRYRSLELSDARTSLFFLFLVQSGFFSVGNIASVASFSLDSVYRLIPIFDPFSQGLLLLFKLIIPFAVISANLGILNRRLGVAPSSLFMLVMAISDVLTMNFFWLVRDEGSWLDIGTSISHFFIANLLCIFVAGLEFVSEVFVSGVEVDGENVVKEKPSIGATDGKDADSGVKVNGNGNGNAEPRRVRKGKQAENSI